jgi:hypothetical protein
MLGYSVDVGDMRTAKCWGGVFLRKLRISDTSALKRGRPKKLHADETTLNELRGLGQIGCTVKEAAAFFRVAVSTFVAFLNEPGVRGAFEEGQGNFRISLRRAQWRLAEKSATMAIFLGKNYLGQSDRGEFTSEMNVDLSRLTTDQLEKLRELKAAVECDGLQRLPAGAGSPS